MPHFSTFLPLNALPDRYIGTLRRLSGQTVYQPCHDAKQAIFVHVPKVAGTSISLAIFGQETGHFSAQMYKYTNPAKFHSYFKFGFVRDPADRFSSAYNYLKNGGSNKTDNHFAKTYIDRHEDMASFLEMLLKEKKDFGFSKALNWGHFLPQFEFLCDRNEIQVDYVGRFENLQSDFEFISHKVSGEQATLPHLNASRAHRLDQAGEDERKLIWQIYQEDYELFGYDAPQ
ncbi:MAG: sulfotransferase family 2 domain-containing protein [Rhizobiales bacterium]|nr:sulfotransferase family 2 domain-containing protein [Hyphomicrobiales bacterium]